MAANLDPSAHARALWYVAPNKAEIAPAQLDELAPDHCRIKTLFSAISRGTESLVFAGNVPVSEYGRMATPLMAGRFPFPVAYGYCNVGRVIEGPEPWFDKTVFCLGPHQTVFDAPSAMLAQLPPSLPARRAVLAANMETALNAVWMGKPGPADHMAIVGGGVVGLLVAYLCSQMPGAHVTLIDPNQDRAKTCRALGVDYASAPQNLTNCDVVFHASGHPDGLQDALSIAGNEASVIELSWYGSQAVSVQLGGAFHSQQLRLQSCQVGHIEQSHQARWSYHRRLLAALSLLSDSRLEALLELDIAFETLPQQISNILGTGQSRLCQVVAYP